MSPTVNWPDTKKFAQAMSIRSANTTDNAIPGNAVYLFNAAGTLTLRDAPSNSGALVTIRNISAHTSGVLVTVAPASGQFVEGQPSVVLAPKQSVTVVSDGANWRIAASPVPQRQIVARTTAYSVPREDLLNSNTVLCQSGTFTVTLPDASSVSSGNSVAVKNAGAGVITVATTNSQTVDGSASLSLAAQDRGTFVSTGSAWVRL